MRCASPPESVRVRAMHREIVQPDVAEELDAVARFLENVRRDLSLELAELERVEPREQPIDRELAHLGDRFAADANLKCLRAAAWCRDTSGHSCAV